MNWYWQPVSVSGIIGTTRTFRSPFITTFHIHFLAFIGFLNVSSTCVFKFQIAPLYNFPVLIFRKCQLNSSTAEVRKFIENRQMFSQNSIHEFWKSFWFIRLSKSQTFGKVNPVNQRYYIVLMTYVTTSWGQHKDTTGP